MGYKLGRDENGNSIKIPFTEVEQEAIDRMLAPMKAAHEDARRRGLQKGNGGRGEVKCPNCSDGTVRYTVASLNGHIWGACTTSGCASWME